MLFAAGRAGAHAVRPNPTNAMRLRCATLGLLVLAVFPARGVRGEDDGLAHCERNIIGASDDFFARRSAVLAGCVAKAARCPAALAGQTTAADDPCLAAVGE